MKDINKIFEETPDNKLWNSIENKLEQRKSAKKIKLYRIASLAAMFVALIAAISYFNLIINDHNPHLFASNEGFSSYVLEDLSNDQEGLFNMASFDEIRKAYNDQFGPKIPIQMAGNYVAQDGEISIDIYIKDYTYYLEFSYAEFPTFVLDHKEDQTLYFASKHYNLTLNLEQNGLKLIDSNFLPEYQNFTFNRLKSI
ncbi:hypothetical protein [Portibacter lacus]|uniref:DUF4825 domain-containing protein n=1 Tax=Portibacter lacus TaxID=1099794 RepID=A0AA37STA5_9BACT|nr:hypothetical protein [Portibacter lacus]GLR18381.1 hypothetical protein GCM10007940_29970 [Portibacter lacus]